MCALDGTKGKYVCHCTVKWEENLNEAGMPKEESSIFMTAVGAARGYVQRQTEINKFILWDALDFT